MGDEDEQVNEMNRTVIIIESGSDELTTDQAQGRVNDALDYVAEHVKPEIPRNHINHAAAKWREETVPDEPVDNIKISTQHGPVEIITVKGRNADWAVGDLSDNDREWHLVLTDASRADPADIATHLRNGRTVHFVASEVTVRAHGDGVQQAVQALAGHAHTTAADDGDARVKRHDGGRPPLAHAVEDGWLVRDDNWGEVASAVQAYASGTIDAEEAADRVGCAAATIEAAAEDRPGLYGVEE